MAFWSSQTLKVKLEADGLMVPYDECRVTHSAYEMGVGTEAYVTSNPSDKTLLPAGDKIVIPPGQFGLLVTHERVSVPANAIAFISIRAGIKFQGLVNVSGFHVDPGYQGHLKFAVYNAGSRAIVLDQGQRIFMIWFADLDGVDQNPYPERIPNAATITADDVSRIHGDVASPAELKRQLDELKEDVAKKFHTTEQMRLYNRALVTLFLGIAITIAVAWFKPYMDRRFRMELGGASQSDTTTNQSGQTGSAPLPRRILDSSATRPTR
jgi:dCTP deaminase